MPKVASYKNSNPRRVAPGTAEVATMYCPLPLTAEDASSSQEGFVTRQGHPRARPLP